MGHGELLGLVTFTNQLKSSAPGIIQTLRSIEIDVKMITGDNIYVAVQTAMGVGIVPPGKNVAVVEGKLCEHEGRIPIVSLKLVNN